MEPGEPENLETLIRNIRGGDNRAEDELVRRFSARVRAVARRMVGDDDSADDIHQEVFLALLKRLRRSDLADPAAIFGFIVRIAQRKVFAHRAARRRRAEQQELPTLRTDDVLRRVLERERLHQTLSAMSRLGEERDREVLFRLYIADENRADVQNAMGLSAEHLSRVAYRARRRLRRLLKNTRGR
jgi:RNA polymerase sigma factor (sigma-70 family)